MKLEMYVNDFCPDNCKNYEQEKELCYDGFNFIEDRNSCKHKEICYFAYHLRDEVTE